MPRVAGVDIPDNKPLRIAMRYIHGIGPKLAEDVLKEAGLDPQARAHTLSEDDQARLNQIIDNNHAVEGGLRRKVQQEIQRLKEIRCYRGDRHKRGLPVRGQRTRTNARTRKGRKKTVAGKKGVKG